MSKTKKDSKVKQLPPAKTPEAWEDRLIGLAYAEAEKQLLAGTASSQIVNHFLKLGSSKESLEKDILREKSKLMSAQTQNLEDSKRTEETYQKAIDAMKIYSGHGEEDHYDEDL